MKRFIGALAMVTALAGSLAMGGTSEAQIPDNFKLKLDPTTVTPGGRLHATPINACPPGSSTMSWSLGPGALNGSVPVDAASGRWDLTFNAPSTPGAYPFFATCMHPTRPEATAMYSQMSFTVAVGGRVRYTG